MFCGRTDQSRPFDKGNSNIDGHESVVKYEHGVSVFEPIHCEDGQTAQAQKLPSGPA